MIALEIEGILSVLMIISALSIQMRVFIKPMLNSVIVQSFILAALAVFTGLYESSYTLIVLAILIVLLRGFLITSLLRRKIPEDPSTLREDSITTSTVILSSIFVFILSLVVYRILFLPLLGHPLGSIGLSLIAQGILLMITRKNSFAHVIGYIEEENGIVLLSLLVIPLPLLIEVSALLDVFGIVLVSVILVREDITHDVFEELIG
ncbi:MAG: hypothetical protein M1267_04525 [Candidatus Thermoplasmatota archaeon]|jgi:hydrogenase-4 component E|nr:hypothetical protein [Candidatus Thermoplasmatota archaeon]